MVAKGGVRMVVPLLEALKALRERWEREAGADVSAIMLPAQLALLDVLEVLGAHPDEYAQVLPKSNPGRDSPGCSLPLYLVAKGEAKSETAQPEG